MQGVRSRTTPAPSTDFPEDRRAELAGAIAGLAKLDGATLKAQSRTL